MKEYLAEIIAAAPARGALNVMREYLQARILETLQTRGASNSIAFMGGTALRFLYRIPRFSEDLDFALVDSDAEYDFTDLVRAVREAFVREGYVTTAKISDAKTVHQSLIGFPGLEHELGLSAHPDKVFSVKIEVDTNPPDGAGIEATMVRKFVALRLVHHDRASLLAGKAAAILLRDRLKGRDIYDLVWFLSDAGWPAANEDLVRSACVQAGRNELGVTGDAWRHALVARLRDAPWTDVALDVQRFLERPEDEWMVRRETVLALLEQRGW